MGKKQIMDGCTAATYIAYAMSDVATIYPITPIAEMGETADKWAATGVKNLMGQAMEVHEMESELGAAGATHGALSGGALACTFTSSQGLMLMIPNMYKISGELLPGVFHVGSRCVAGHALSIFCDHSDVMACRATGFVMLCSDSVQATHDMAIVAHLAAIEGSLPVLHWFDGWRTSNEMQTIDTVDYEDLRPLMPWDKVEAFRRRAMNPEHSDVRGTAQNPDIYFQNREACNPWYDRMADIVQAKMDAVAKLTGRQYHLFDYVGDPDAEYVTVSMCSSSDVADETVDYLNAHGYKVGHIKVHLYRPFAADRFAALVPATCKRIAVLDRTKEPGAIGEPLYQDVCTALFRAGRLLPVMGGRYGLGSKDFNPSMLKAIFDEMASGAPREHFTVGIDDDVTHLSLDVRDAIDPIAPEARQAVFYGFGSDGTVGATKQAAKIISDNTDLYSQAYFNYSAKKSGGYTLSQLRFSPNPIRASYSITGADIVVCTKDVYVKDYPLLDNIKDGGTFLLCSSWSLADMERIFPASLKRQIAGKHLKFYNVDATAIARRHNLGSRINMIMETVFFSLIDIIPADRAAALLKERIADIYAHEGQNVVDDNNAAVDDALSAAVAIPYPASWATSTDAPEAAPAPDETPLQQWVRRVARPMNALRGDSLPVSLMIADGVFPAGTTAFEKRRIAIDVPQWDAEKCIECTECSFVCSHAAIRPVVATAEEMADAPQTFVTKDAWPKPLKGMRFRIQVYAEDCTGCASCATVCPANALTMVPLDSEVDVQRENLAFADAHISDKGGLLPRFSIDGSQLYRPLMEFSGACGGCGETPYIKLLTQLFGEHMVIANATGCSSIWGANAPSQAYCRNAAGLGPAWGNSLFEDNAEYGYGIAVGLAHRRERLRSAATAALASGKVDSDMADALKQWLDAFSDSDASYRAGLVICRLLAADPGRVEACPELAAIRDDADVLGRKTVWIIGGDGWAYDIGFAGLDHVLASGIDINVFVMDTQCYSNTGGQTSKATPFAACTKYDYAGKRTYAKDLGRMMQTYRNVYVASVAIGGNMQQTVEAFREAEAYRGPSIVIGYCPCIAFGIKAGMGTTILAQRDAVTNGYWPIYRYNPAAADRPLTYERADAVATGAAGSPELQGPPQWSPKPWVKEKVISFGASVPRKDADSPLVDDNAAAPEPMQPMLDGENRYAVLPDRVGTSLADAMYANLAANAAATSKDDE